MPRWQRGAGSVANVVAGTAEGARPIPNFLSEVILDISDFSMLLTRLRPSKGSAVFNRFAHSAGPCFGGPGVEARGSRAEGSWVSGCAARGRQCPGGGRGGGRRRGDKTRRTTRRWGSQPVCLRLAHPTPHCLPLERTWRWASCSGATWWTGGSASSSCITHASNVSFSSIEKQDFLGFS